MEIKRYDLIKEGLEFKSDFNWNFDLLRHIVEVRTKESYLKIDFVQNKKTKKYALTKRVANFKTNKAIFEVKNIRL